MADDLDLIRTYEPVLRFSKDSDGSPENFYPMAAHDYVKGCRLRRAGGVGWECPPDETLLRYVGEVPQSDQCYLVYAAEDLLSLLRQAVPDDIAFRLLDQGLSLARAGDAMELEVPASSEAASFGGYLPVDDTYRAALQASPGLPLPPADLPGREPSPPQAIRISDRRFLSLPADVHRSACEKYEAYRHRPPVYHYHVCEDEGYRVLQYWLLYAYNDWATHHGANDHEGDWEMVCVFLDSQDKPQWVACSRHIKVSQLYGPDRARWSSRRLQKVKGAKQRATHPVVYVGCGSHANYLQRGSDRLVGLWLDCHEGNDESIGPGMGRPWGNPIRLDGKPWTMHFAGNWGALIKPVLPWGTEGPKGPVYQRADNWKHPVRWAEIPGQSP